MSVTIEEAQARLPELIAQLGDGESLVITQGQQPIARLLVERQTSRKPRRPGTAKGILQIVSEDDEHLADFAEYLE